MLPAHAPAPEGLPTDWRSIHERLCRAHSSAAGHQRGANAGSSPLSRMGWHMAALPLMKPNGDDSGNRPPILGVLLVVTELLQPSAASSDGPVQERPGGNTAAADVPEVGPPSSVHTASEAFKANLLSRLGAGTINPKPDATKASLLASRPTSTNSTAGHLLVSADVSVGRGGAESATLQSLTLEASVGGGTPREALSRISLPVSGHRAHRRSLVLSSKGVPVPGAAAGGSAQGEDIQGGPGSQRLQQQVQWSGEQQALQQLQAAADALAAECLVPDELRACAYKVCTAAGQGHTANGKGFWRHGQEVYFWPSGVGRGISVGCGSCVQLWPPVCSGLRQKWLSSSNCPAASPALCHFHPRAPCYPPRPLLTP